MPQNPKRKTDKVELAKRIRIVQDWILQDHTSTDIINQSMAQWSVTDRQAYRYLWAANRFFEERANASVDKKVHYYLARKRKLLRDMDPSEKKTAAGVVAINRVLDSMAKMEGITVDTMKIVGDLKNPIITESKVSYTSPTIDYSKMPTEVLKYLYSLRTTDNG